MASYTRNHFEVSIKRWKHLCSRECLDHSIGSIILYSTWTRFGFHGIAKALTTLRGSKRGTEICGPYFRKHDTRTMCRGNCTDGTFASHSLLDPMCWFSQGSNLVTHIWQSSAEPTALTVCLPACLSVHLSDCLSGYLSIYLSICSYCGILILSNHTHFRHLTCEQFQTLHIFRALSNFGLCPWDADVHPFGWWSDTIISFLFSSAEATFRKVWKIDTLFLFCTIFNFGMESVITLSSY